MGGDGGATVNRNIIVSVRKHKGHEQDPRLTAHGRYTHCAMSGQPLTQPVVACELGNLYNKEAILQFLLAKKKKKSIDVQDEPHHKADKESLEHTFTHIQRLRDVIDCHIVWQSSLDAMKKPTTSTGPTPDDVKRGKEYLDPHEEIGSNYIYCPITNEKAYGGQQFVVMRSCGCVLSLKGYTKLITSSIHHDTLNGRALSCVVCSQPLPETYQARDRVLPPTSFALLDAALQQLELCFIPLIPDPHQLQYLQRLVDLKAAKGRAKSTTPKPLLATKRQRIQELASQSNDVVQLQGPSIQESNPKGS